MPLEDDDLDRTMEQTIALPLVVRPEVNLMVRTWFEWPAVSSGAWFPEDVIP
jgi:hypothetical protein